MPAPLYMPMAMTMPKTVTATTEICCCHHYPREPNAHDHH
jgi:hypothetical protein